MAILLISKHGQRRSLCAQIKEATGLPVFLATDEGSVAVILKEQPCIRIVVVCSSMEKSFGDIAESMLARMARRQASSAHPHFVVFLDDNPEAAEKRPLPTGAKGPVGTKAAPSFIALIVKEGLDGH